MGVGHHGSGGGGLIRATTEVMELGQLPDGTSVFQNLLAYESDGVVVNRINAHTPFKSHMESGLCKTMVVGLGNPSGAAKTVLACEDCANCL
jgi:hypothetical protein